MDTISRLQMYYSLLINDCDHQIDDSFEEGMSMTRINEITEIPLPVIRNDFYTLFGWQSRLLEENQEISIEFLDLDDEDISSRESFKEDILKGELDNIPIYHFASDEYRIPITYEELKALENYHPKEARFHSLIESIQNKVDNKYLIKDSYQCNHQYIDINNKLEIINDAINYQESILIAYRNRENVVNNITIKPIKISYDGNENLYCILSYYNNIITVYRLDRILSIKPSKEVLENNSIDITSFGKKVWGNNYNDTPIQVKVRFYNEANVWEKVKKDLYYREGNLHEKDGYLYYEDIVYGKNSFRSWIYGYGSSAIVLEPKELRDEIIVSLLERRKADGR